jgi:molybdopterin converting factor small subunit
LATVHIPALLQPLTGGVSRVEAAGSTLREVIADVVRQQPALAGRIADATGILPEIMIAIGDSEAKTVDTPVPEGAEVWVLPALAGG